MSRAFAAISVVAGLILALLGVAPAHAALQGRDAPAAPTGLIAYSGPTVGDVTLDWDSPDDTTIDSYNVRYHFSSVPGGWVDGGNTGSPVSHFVVSGLDPKASYVFEVAAVNDDGVSGWSNTSNGASPLGALPPSNLVATPGDGVVNLSWTAPSPPPLGYDIQYKSSGLGAIWEPADPLSTSGTSFRVTDLYADKEYRFRVRATNGGSAVSNWVETTTPVSPLSTPGAPQSLQAAPGDGQVALSWVAPFPAPGGYEVQYRAASSGTWQPGTPTPVSGTSYTVTGLTNGTPYVFQVRSVRGSAASAWVQSATVTPSGAWVVPAAPTSLTAVPGDGLAVMYWTVAAGNPATGYEVQYSTNNSTWFPTAAQRTGSTNLNYVLAGLSNGVAYYLRVRTVNGPQVSGWTQMAGTVTPVGVPGAPTSVNGVPGNQQVTVSWIPPAYQGSPVTGYRVQLSTNGGLTWVPAVDLNTPATSTVVGGLTNGVTYTFRVAAFSAAGNGTWSVPSAAVVPPGGPGAPTNVIAVAGNAQASVGWNAPAGTQSSPLTGYRVTASPGGQTCFTSATPPVAPATTCNVTGLTNGQAYTFTVVSVSAIGVSVPSAPSTPVIPVGGPNPPASVTAVAGDRQATVSWTPATPTAGFPVTAYRVTSSPDGRTCTTNATPPNTPATTCTVTGLTNGQAYTFTVVAISAGGTSASSPASAPVTPFTTEVTIRITDSSRDGKKITIKGTTQGMDPGDTLDVLIRNSSKGKFQPAGEVTVKTNGTFRWTTNNVNKTWIRVTDGDVVSNTVIVSAR